MQNKTTKRNVKNNKVRVVGLGSVDPIEATYGETIPEYRGNPLIEALRQEPGRNELRKDLGCRLKYDFDFAMGANSRQRKEMVETLKFFFVPLPRHLDLVNGIFSMIRKGYASRNPAWGEQDSRLEASLESAGLFGPSGTGKTQSVRRILKLIPQVIHHSNYNGRTVDETQVTWINVECPPTPRALCASILDKTDKILGTNYESIYGGTRSTISDMMPGVRTLVRNHCLGLLVIDEVQNLFHNRNRSAEELESFIVEIVNDWGLPVLLVGTSENFHVVSENFRIRRRLTGLPQPEWGRLDHQDPEWKLFTDELLKYRYVENEFDLNELRPWLFELTRGIPDLATKLMALSQIYAIDEGIKEITPKVLQAVMRKSLSQNDGYLEFLRKGLKPIGDYKPAEVWTQQSFEKMPAPQKTKKPDKPKPNPDKQIPLGNLLGNVSSHAAAKEAGTVFQENELPT